MKNILIILCFMSVNLSIKAQKIPYGSNPKAGKYLTVGDTKLYYEIYGEGQPLLLLHGDVFGYIDEFEAYFPYLVKHFKVIAIGMRGHGKSELGHQPLSTKLLADDAIAILNNETNDSAMVLGFSTGAILSYYLAANYPDKIKKVVALAGSLGLDGAKKEMLEEQKKMKFSDLEKQYPDFFAGRKKIMAEPDRYPELLESLKTIWFEESHVSIEKVRNIKCPVLTIGGDSDEYFYVENFIHINKVIPNSSLCIMPSNHVGLIMNGKLCDFLITPYLLEN